MYRQRKDAWYMHLSGKHIACGGGIKHSDKVIMELAHFRFGNGKNKTLQENPH